MILPTTANVVILASNCNPSIVSKEWLRRKRVFTDTVRNFVHTPVLSLVESDQFRLMVDESRLQFTVRKVTQDNLSALTTIPQRFVKALPETPYTAVGLNYSYMFPGQRCDLDTILAPKRERLGELLAPTYQLGATVVFAFEKFVATLTISPPFGKQTQTRIQLNFHSNVLSLSEVEDALSLQTKAFEKAESIVQGVCKNV